jgi:TonB family protein
VLLVVGLTDTASVSASQARGILTGAVYDPFGVPVEGVTVSIESGPFGSGSFAEMVTSRSGEYRFEKLPPGVYTISSSVADPLEVSLDQDVVLRRDIRMQVDEVSGSFSVCVDCEGEIPRYTPPESLVREFASDREAASKQLVTTAEPEVGWEYYEPDVRVTDSIRDARLTGTVRLEARVERDGAVTGVRVVSSPHPELGAAAAAALRSQRWRPALVRGRPMAVPLRLTIEFVRARRADDPPQR